MTLLTFLTFLTLLTFLTFLTLLPRLNNLQVAGSSNGSSLRLVCVQHVIVL